jgi:hypothetical protein
MPDLFRHLINKIFIVELQNPADLQNPPDFIPAVEPEMDSIPYLRERQLPPAPPSVRGVGGRRCLNKSGMTGRKNQVFQSPS